MPTWQYCLQRSSSLPSLYEGDMIDIRDICFFIDDYSPIFETPYLCITRMKVLLNIRCVLDEHFQNTSHILLEHVVEYEHLGNTVVDYEHVQNTSHILLEPFV